MTEQDKQLLLVDLCARLPYSVILNVTLKDKYDEIVNRDIEMFDNNLTYMISDSHWKTYKPYLRPMSSMTEEERKIQKGYIYHFSKNSLPDYEGDFVFRNEAHEYIDWLNKNHFDYRGLIEKGLALVAPDDMYGKEE